MTKLTVTPPGGAEQLAARQAAAQYRTVMNNLTTDWSALTSAAKLEAVRAGVVLGLRILRHLARSVFAESPIE